MGHVIKNGLELLGTGTNVRINPDLAAGIDNMVCPLLHIHTHIHICNRHIDVT